ncbi:MAG: mercury resistance system transport protein MerF [Candidatus Rokuibacteriota bacterium]
MWRDGWFRVGALGALVACLACVTPAAALVFATVGLAGWAGPSDVVLVPALVGFAALVAYRAWRCRRIS